MTRRLLFSLFVCGLLGCNGQIASLDGSRRIVILGSSTAYGTGADPSSAAWANLYAEYARLQNSQLSVVNLAEGGFTTYQLLPTGSASVANRPGPRSDKNISAALTYAPVAILINLPGNDVSVGYAAGEVEQNFEQIIAAAAQAHVPLWVTTTRPLNLAPAGIQELITLRDWTYSRFGDHGVDSWTGLANPDGTMNPVYTASDGLHLNNAGHRLLFDRFVQARILESLGLKTTP